MDYKDFTIEEKNIISEVIIDDLLTEEGWGSLALGAVQTAQGLGHDAVRVAGWLKKKKQEKLAAMKAKRDDETKTNEKQAPVTTRA